MKYRYGLLVLMLAAALILPSASSIAMEEMETTTEAASYEIQDDTQATDFQTKLAERLAARKAAMQTKLTTSQQTRIKNRCKAAQQAVAQLAEKTKTARMNRDEAYKNILKHATSLRDKLKENGKDTAALDTNITELTALVDKFSTDMQTLRQAVADISNMDCTAEPTSFKATIEAMREARKVVADDAVAIRTYVKDHLKVTLQAIHTSLGGNKEEETN